MLVLDPSRVGVAIELLQLPDLLLKCHLRQQIIDSSLCLRSRLCRSTGRREADDDEHSEKERRAGLLVTTTCLAHGDGFLCIENLVRQILGVSVDCNGADNERPEAVIARTAIG